MNPSVRRAGRSAGVVYAVAVLLVAASLLFRLLLQPWFSPKVTYLQFFPAIMVAGWYGGFGPGLLATALSVAATMYFLMPPVGFAIEDLSDAISLAIFAATGIGISWLNQLLRSSEQANNETAALATVRAERLDAVLNTAMDGIIVIDANGRVEAFNKSAERLFGYEASEVIGQDVSLLMPAPDVDQHHGHLLRYLTTGDARVIGVGREVKGRRKDGTLVPMHLSVGEMWIQGERKFTGMLHDLTRRAYLVEQLDASEARWRAVIDSAVDGIVVIDARGSIESFNPGAERLFGYTESEVIGQNVSMLMPSPYKEEHDAYIGRYLSTGQPKIIGSGRQVSGRRKDGTTFPVHISVGQITVGGERKFTGILHNLSDRVRIEDRLREQASLVRLGEMAAVIAHEVKNPLAAVRGAIQVIGQRLPADSHDTAVIREIVDRIDSLDEMVKDLLLFARPPRPRTIVLDVVSLLESTVHLLSRDPALRDVDVRVMGASPPVPADPEMLKIVFQNLLMNSAHAMNGHGHVMIAVGHSDSTCRIAIADTGPGIPADLRQKVFAPFFTTKTRGTGLGLATAKRLVEAHGGEISVDCPPEGGATFTIQLPLAPRQLSVSEGVDEPAARGR